jgi:hypothetical protein
MTNRLLLIKIVRYIVLLLKAFLVSVIWLCCVY